MFFYGTVSGHDFMFHVESWMDVAGQWHEGNFYPRWAEWANWGFGEPRFVFYPPLSWLTGAALGSLLPWKMVPGTFIWLALVVAGISMWRLASGCLSKPYANLAAVLYAASPYHLVIIFYRSAFGELVAAALLPLLIWAALRVVWGEWRRIPVLALVFAGIWLSNAPAAVIATYSLGVVIAVGCFLRRNLSPLALGGSAMAGGFGLAAFYIVPAAWEQSWIQIAQVVSRNVQPSANFLFTHSNDPDFVAFNRKVSWVALALIVVTLIAALSTFAKRSKFQRPWWTLCVLGLVATTFMVPPSLWLWRTLPKLWFVQFPWRWLDVLGVAFAFFVAAAISELKGRAASWSATAFIFAAIAASGAVMVIDAPWDSSDLPALAAAIQAGRGYEGTNEYAPIGCDRYQLPGNPDDTERPSDVSPNPAPRFAKVDEDSDDLVPATGVRLHTQSWTSERRVFTADTEAPVTLALRLVNYPAWNVQINGRDAPIDSRPETAQELVQLPAGNNRVELRFRHTRDRILGDAISALAAAMLAAFAWRFRKPRLAEPM
jgi:hypothetical protein